MRKNFRHDTHRVIEALSTLPETRLQWGSVLQLLFHSWWGGRSIGQVQDTSKKSADDTGNIHFVFGGDVFLKERILNTNLKTPLIKSPANNRRVTSIYWHTHLDEFYTSYDTGWPRINIIEVWVMHDIL